MLNFLKDVQAVVTGVTSKRVCVHIFAEEDLSSSISTARVFLSPLHLNRSVADNFFLVSALTTSALVGLHTVWSVVSLEALRMRGSFPLLCFAPAAHLIASWTTLFYSGGEHRYPVYALLALLLLSAMVAFSLLNGRLRPLWPRLGLALTGVRKQNFEAAFFQYQPQRDGE